MKSKRYFPLVMLLIVLSTLSMFAPIMALITIDFSGITSPSSTHIARYDIDEAVKENNPNIGTEFTTPMYVAISTSDDTYAVTRVLHQYDYAQQIFRFQVPLIPREFTLTWEGNIAFAQIGWPHTFGIDIWNGATNSWESIGVVSQVGDFDGAGDPPPVGASVQGVMSWMVPDEIISNTYSANTADYVDSGYITLMVWGKNSHDATVATDYVKLSYTTPVGGVWVPINITALLNPWITLASVIAPTVVAASIVYIKRRKKKQN